MNPQFQRFARELQAAEDIRQEGPLPKPRSAVAGSRGILNSMMLSAGRRGTNTKLMPRLQVFIHVKRAHTYGSANEPLPHVASVLANHLIAGFATEGLGKIVAVLHHAVHTESSG